ncbi:hypothetical protein Hsc_4499 [Herbaspirillum seropedicae]|nr:hypothetical protein Hsc_4499 [Herbaspirillum seropedicae]
MFHAYGRAMLVASLPVFFVSGSRFPAKPRLLGCVYLDPGRPASRHLTANDPIRTCGFWASSEDQEGICRPIRNYSLGVTKIYVERSVQAGEGRSKPLGERLSS